MSNDDEEKIKTKQDGAYKVYNVTKFKTSEGKPIKTSPIMSLCCCGKSGRKPFCDGTHKKIGFTSAKEDDRQPDRIDDYKGKIITIHDNRGVCSHAGHCTDNLPTVWRMKAEPWIDADAESAEEIIRVIKMCPSGALSYTKDGIKYDSLDREPAILLSKNGPLRVVGGIEFEDYDGEKPHLKEHYTLCRCGGSKNKPFCNGQHWYNDFDHDESDVPLEED
jgi:CDGSH-type Zn-finger protein